MKPIGPLMREHRLIERMVALLREESCNIARTGKVRLGFLDAAIEFFETYADKCHHGKEEDIYFKALLGKPLSADHSAIIEELIEEHALARKTLARLKTAKERHSAGAEALAEIVECMEAMTGLYPRHIEKEDEHFFFPSLQYLSRQEQDSMLIDFMEFDGRMIQGIYEKKVKEIEEAKDRHPWAS